MRLLSLAVALLFVACSHGPSSSSARTSGDNSSAQAQLGEVVRPPFAVRGDLANLLLVWFDGEGAHTATRRDEIPADRREFVRVDSFDVPEAQQLDPDYVYVADLRAPAAGGDYVVRKVSRDAFDARAERLRPAPAAPAAEVANVDPAQVAPVDDDESAHPSASRGAGKPNQVIIYGASWCGACHQAASFLRARGVQFVERDIERDPGARQEMQSKCSGAHLRCSGIPVIDARGTILEGFSAQALAAALGG